MVISFLTTAIICLSFGTLASAETWSTLSNPVWTKGIDSDYLKVINDIHVIPNKNLVYLHMQEEKMGYTKAWMFDTLNAVNPETGEIKWKYNFYGAGLGYLTTEDPFMYASNGTVYAYFGWNRLLYSINSNGKANWMIKLPDEGKMHLMKNGTLLLVVPKSAVKGSESTVVYGYNNSGKQIFKKVINGTVEKVTDSYVLVENHSASFTRFKADVYDSSMKRIFRYDFPQSAYTEIGYTMVLSDGTIIFRANLAKTGNRLIALSSKGKVLWGRDIPGNSVTVEAGANYIVYVDKTVSLYNLKGLVAKRVFSDLTDEFEIYPRARMTDDHKLWLDLIEKQYVVDPTTLSTVQEFKLADSDANIIYYNGDTVYAHFEKNNQIAKYKLK